MTSTDDLRDRLDQLLSGQYRIERELGGGGMSRVFAAEELALGRRVVVKVLAPELAEDLSAERFAREAKLAARLQDPRIVPVLAAGSIGNLPYYTMPFVEGESLRARMARAASPGQAIPTTEAIAVLRDVALALEYAHAHDVVHRDIKPENVLLSGRTAVVADFGIAKALAAANTTAGTPGATLTEAGISLGTPAYMAPEQAVGDAVDHRADLYAWGVMAYELLAGEHPFAGKTSGWTLDSREELGHAIAIRYADKLGTRDRLYLGPTDPDSAATTYATSLARRETAVQTAPDAPDLWYRLGDYQVHFGAAVNSTAEGWRRAAAALERGLELDSTNAPLFEHLPMVYRYLGDTAKAWLATVRLLRDTSAFYYPADRVIYAADSASRATALRDLGTKSPFLAGYIAIVALISDGDLSFVDDLLSTARAHRDQNRPRLRHANAIQRRDGSGPTWPRHADRGGPAESTRRADVRGHVLGRRLDGRGDTVRRSAEPGLRCRPATQFTRLSHAPRAHR